MTDLLQNSYLQRYEQRQQSKESRSPHKSTSKAQGLQSDQAEAHTIAAVVSKLQQRVDGIDVKLTSLVNVVKLLQKYTQTKDDQYEKQKQNQFFKRVGQAQYCGSCGQLQSRLKQFNAITKQFKQELKGVQKLKASLVLNPVQIQKISCPKWNGPDLQSMEGRLREEINKKMEICVKIINSNWSNSTETEQKGLSQRVDQLSFSLNQLQNQCRRNRMMMDKEIQRLTAVAKDNSTAIPNHSRVSEIEGSSKSPGRRIMTNNKSKNSKSDKSLSRGKQNKSAVLNIPKQCSKVRQQEMREALRKKREHRQRLKVRNF